jgi:lysophospholipase L1-like esterase
MPEGRSGARQARRPAALLVASCLGLVAGSVLPARSVATAADPLAVMPVGDSITHGSDGDATYRYFLWQELQRAGRSVDLVGTMRGVRGGSPRHADFDQDHDGHGGFRADELVDGRPDRRSEGRLAGWVAAERPDVILLHIGTNDIRQCQSVDSTIADIDRALDVARTVRPDVTVLLARIIPSVGTPQRPCAADVPARIRQLNDRIAALAEAKTTARAPVRVVDQHAGFDVGAHTSDGVHPNEAGERRIASRWAAALADLVPAGGGTTTTTSAPTTTTSAPTTTTSAPITTTTSPPATTPSPPPTTSAPTSSTIPTAPAPPAPSTTAPPVTSPQPPTSSPTSPPRATEAPRTGYWMVGATGDVYAFGDAAWLGNASVGTRSAVGIEGTPDHDGYWVVDDGGTVHAFGSAADLGDASGLAPGERVTGMAATRSGSGYWLSTDRGRVLALGDAGRHGDLADATLNAPVVGAARAPQGGGYHLVASDGGVFGFGAARFHGSMGDRPMRGRVVALAADADGDGYWLVGADGGVFAFGAPFLGSMGGQPLNAPIVGMVPYGSGYLLVGADGGTFAFSDAPFAGSLGASPPPAPIVDVAALDEGRG